MPVKSENPNKPDGINYGQNKTQRKNKAFKRVESTGDSGKGNVPDAIIGAQEETRTPTVLPPPGPEPGASTNFATWAKVNGEF